MKAYKCGICGRYFEDELLPAEERITAKGHYSICLYLETNTEDYTVIHDDICPECAGYITTGLIEKGCSNENVRYISAEYLADLRSKMQK